MATKRKTSVEKETSAKAKGQKMNNQKYLEKYSVIPGINPSQKGDNYAHCLYCSCDFSIGHGGKFDISRHVASKSHITCKQVVRTNNAITTFMPHRICEGETERAVIKSEALMTEFFVQMNLPLASADTFNRLVRTAFPDSKIAKKFECGRSKTTAIVKELSDMQKTDVVARMRSGPFSVATDGSNDQRDKQFPVVVTTFSEFGIHTDLLGVPVLKTSATGENIFKLLDSELRSKDIPWSNCLSFGTDNANVMIGRKKGVYAFILEQEPSVFLSGCPCHLLHHAAEKAASCFPFCIDDILVDTYYYLDKSSKRQIELDSLQTLYDVNHHKILKHVPTRWLSISRCLDRILQNWDALKVYFVTEKSNLARQSTTYKQTKVNNLETFFRSPTNRLYCIFLKFALQPFDKLNTTLQGEKPLIHKLRRLLHKLMRDLLIRFVVPKALHGKSVTEVQFENDVYHKKNDDLIIGEEARKFISDSDGNRLRESRINEFFNSVKDFYMKACVYINNKLPLNDELLRKAEVADVELKIHNSSGDLHYFLDRFPILMPPDTTKDQILLEYAEFQAEDLAQYQTDSGDDSQTWVTISRLKDAAGIKQFSKLSKVMLAILSIPHSNAQCERIFSCVRKNKTDQRASMGPDTLDALMVLKSKRTPVHERIYSDEQLNKIKSAYYKQLKK